jgi:hypothetical protein
MDLLCQDEVEQFCGQKILDLLDAEYDRLERKALEFVKIRELINRVGGENAFVENVMEPILKDGALLDGLKLEVRKFPNTPLKHLIARSEDSEGLKHLFRLR